MVRKLYHVVFYGEISEGFRVADVRRNLAQAIDLDEPARQRVVDGRTAILRTHIDRMSASMFMTHCESHGACCRLELARVVTGDEKIDVYRLCTLEFRGKLLPGYELNTVKERLQKALNTTAHTIDRLFSEPSTIIKREADFETALKMYDIFAKNGARCHIVPVKTRLPEEKIFSEAVFRPTHLSLTICPKCGHTQPHTELCERCGVAVRHFTRKMEDRRHKQGTDHEIFDKYDDVGAEYDEAASPEICEIGAKDVAVWKIALVGNAMLTLLLTFLHVDLTTILITPLSLIQETPPEYLGFFRLLYSNANILALTGVFFSVAMYVRRTLSNHKHAALHAAYLMVLIMPIGACIAIDFFVRGLVQGGDQLSATRFVLLSLIFSTVAYGVGWLCFLPYILKHANLPPSDDDVEYAEDEAEAEAEEFEPTVRSDGMFADEKP